MAKIRPFQRLDRGEFSREFAELIDRIGYGINAFGADVDLAFNKGISFENLNRSLVSINVELNSNGIPIDDILVNTQVNFISGINVIKADNLTDDTVYPTGHPFISYTLLQNGTIRINHITGLQANNKYRLVLETIGN